MTPEEKAKAVADARQQDYDRRQREAAEKAPGRNLGGALDIFKRKDREPDKDTPRSKLLRALGQSDEPIKKAKGGYVKAADGCAQRGKTRGKVI
jgi:hypothetical protein